MVGSAQLHAPLFLYYWRWVMFIKNWVAAEDLCGRLEFGVVIVRRVQVAAAGPQPGFEAKPWHMLLSCMDLSFLFSFLFFSNMATSAARRRHSSLPAYGAGICLFLSFYGVRRQKSQVSPLTGWQARFLHLTVLKIPSEKKTKKKERKRPTCQHRRAEAKWLGVCGCF